MTDFLCGYSVEGLRAELAEHWGPGLELSASWLGDLEGGDFHGDERRKEELLLDAAQGEVKRLRVQLQKVTGDAEAERVGLKAEVRRLEGELWSEQRAAEVAKKQAARSARAAREVI